MSRITTLDTMKILRDFWNEEDGLIIAGITTMFIVQKCLKLKIEAQGRFLGRIVEENQNGNPKYTKSSSRNQMLKEFETDSEGGKAEIQSEEDFQALKRSRTENHVFLPSQYQLEPLNSVPHNQNMVLQRDSKFSHPSHDVDFIGTNPGCKKTDQIFTQGI
uniref:Uncharacterized protein n=1 Tax=Salix viminalis TaxID=40686 RepID=A0A6N2K9Q4_SALVM